VLNEVKLKMSDITTVNCNRSIKSDIFYCTGWG